MINSLSEGKYFGEIGLITNLKRTATVISTDYCTLSSMSKKVLQTARQEYPIIYTKLKEQISQYQDFDFNFRKKMVKNIPYFRNVDNYII